jgi:hypothetical protein
VLQNGVAVWFVRGVAVRIDHSFQQDVRQHSSEHVMGAGSVCERDRPHIFLATSLLGMDVHHQRTIAVSEPTAILMRSAFATPFPIGRRLVVRGNVVRADGDSIHVVRDRIRKLLAWLVVVYAQWREPLAPLP